MLGNRPLASAPLAGSVAAGAAAVTGTLGATEAADVFAGAGVLEYTGTLAATEAADVFAGAGTLDETGTLAATEAADVFAGVGSLTISGTCDVTEPSDTFSCTGTTGLLKPPGGDDAPFPYWLRPDQKKKKRSLRQELFDTVEDVLAPLPEAVQEKIKAPVKAVLKESLQSVPKDDTKARVAALMAKALEIERLIKQAEDELDEEEAITAILLAL